MWEAEEIQLDEKAGEAAGVWEKVSWLPQALNEKSQPGSLIAGPSSPSQGQHALIPASPHPLLAQGGTVPPEGKQSPTAAAPSVSGAPRAAPSLSLVVPCAPQAGAPLDLGSPACSQLT